MELLRTSVQQFSKAPMPQNIKYLRENIIHILEDDRKECYSIFEDGVIICVIAIQNTPNLLTIEDIITLDAHKQRDLEIMAIRYCRRIATSRPIEIAVGVDNKDFLNFLMDNDFKVRGYLSEDFLLMRSDNNLN